MEEWDGDMVTNDQSIAGHRSINIFVLSEKVYSMLPGTDANPIWCALYITRHGSICISIQSNSVILDFLLLCAMYSNIHRSAATHMSVQSDNMLCILVTRHISSFGQSDIVHCTQAPEYILAYTPQPLYNTIVGVHSINRVS